MSMPCLCCGCLPWQSSLCFNPVRWRIEKEIIGVVFTPVCKAMSGYIKCAAGKNCGPAFRTCTSQIFFPVGLACMSKLCTPPKELFGTKIFARLPQSVNNLMHFNGTEHELKIQDKTVLLPLPPPAARVGVSLQLWCCWPARIEFSFVAALSLSYFVLKLDCQMHHHQLSSIWFSMIP